MTNKVVSFYTGPVFIIGMPRSGTKLLRDILNNHPEVGIPTIETNFFPCWVNEWDAYGDLTQRAVFHRFYQKSLKLSYFLYMREAGRLIEENVWYSLCRNFTPAAVFEALARHDAGVPYGSTGIWGDKSPPYINELRLLKKQFPQARFVHIVRDVRDYCISMKKAWGKNMIRAAQRWSHDVHEASSLGRRFSQDYLEVRYEDLIDNPSSVVKTVCEFLDIDFHNGLINLQDASENLGDARGMKTIKTDNKEKYRTGLKNDTREKIERIAGEVLTEHGYPVEISGDIRKITKFEMAWYKMLDAINLTRFQLKERGVRGFFRWRLGLGSM